MPLWEQPEVPYIERVLALRAVGSASVNTGMPAQSRIRLSTRTEWCLQLAVMRPPLQVVASTFRRSRSKSCEVRLACLRSRHTIQDLGTSPYFRFGMAKESGSSQAGRRTLSCRIPTVASGCSRDLADRQCFPVDDFGRHRSCATRDRRHPSRMAIRRRQSDCGRPGAGIASFAWSLPVFARPWVAGIRNTPHL